MKKSFVVFGLAALLAGCSSEPAPAGSPAATTSKTLSITSKSPEAVEHFKKGEALLDNLRPEDAAQEFKQALTLDPDFVLAHAYHGSTIPGPGGAR